MREIKFRAWDKKNKVMRMVAHMWNLLTVGQSIDVRTNEEGSITKKEEELNEGEFILMQYTGLNDYKRTEEYPEGQEIFKGDIVSFGLWCSPIGSDYMTHRGVIIEEWGAYYIKYISEWDKKERKRLLGDFYYEAESHYVPNVGNVYDRSLLPKNHLEVIGHENQEPLEDK